MAATAYEGTSGDFTVEGPVMEAEVISKTGVEQEEFWAFAAFRAHGVFTRRFSVPGVRARSLVLVAMTECDQLGHLNFRPKMGNAAVKTFNVVPEDNGLISIRGEVVWQRDLLILIYFHVLAR